MMIKKVEICFGGGVQGRKKYEFRFFAVQDAFLPINTHEPHQSCRKTALRCFTTFHQISS